MWGKTLQIIPGMNLRLPMEMLLRVGMDTATGAVDHTRQIPVTILMDRRYMAGAGLRLL